MEGPESLVVHSFEEWQELVDRQIARTSGKVAVTSELEEESTPALDTKTPTDIVPNSEKFVDYPNRQKSLRGVDANGKSVFAKTAIAKKLYRCACCPNEINIGSEHVFVYTVQPTKHYDHHHIHGQCFGERILNNWSEVKVIETKETEPKRLTQRSRRHRGNLSRRRRCVA